jgi:hypothetical protein
MNPHKLPAAWKKGWQAEASSTSPLAEEAYALLRSGLAEFDVRVERADPGSAGSGPVIILNATEHDTDGFSYRIGEERMEFFGDSERGLCFAVRRFLEDMGLMAIRSGEMRKTPTGAEIKAKLRAAPLFGRRRMVVRERIVPGARSEWERWAAARGFDGFWGPERELRLSGGAAALERALDAAPAMDEVILIPDAEDVGALDAYVGEFERLRPSGRLLLLLRASRAARFMEGYAARRKTIPRCLGVVLDDGERCRAHELGDPGCARNARIWNQDLRRAVAAWREAGGTWMEARLRYDDDQLFAALPPPLPSLMGGDLALLRGLELEGVQYLASFRRCDRPSLNAWVFSRLAFPSILPEPADGNADGASPAAQTLENDIWEFCWAYGGERSAAQSLREYYRDLETAWKIALDREGGRDLDEGGLCPAEPPRTPASELFESIPPSALDPWDEPLERQDERASAFSEAYARLDACMDSLSGITDSVSEEMEREIEAFRAQEAAIEILGIQRALYAEAMRESGSPSGIALMADGALLILEKRLRAILPPGPGRDRAERFLLTSYRFRIFSLYHAGARGPLARLRAALFRSSLSRRYSRLTH